MKFKAQKQDFLTLLINSGIDKNEAIIELDLITKKISGISKTDFIINPDIELPVNLLEKISIAINERITTKKPIQYILNEANFMGENFYVDENVLIPRDETEILVNETFKITETINIIRHPELVSGSNHNTYNTNTKQILDIGTGSGCIACMLAKLTQQNITAVDISAEALEVAKKNAQNMGISEKITFLQSDLFENIVKQKFDIIVSNPPYIPISEKTDMQKEVVLHEPHLALFTEDIDGVDIYKKIIETSKDFLNENGYILFELGINQSKIVTDIFISNGFTITKVIKDLSGIERVIVAQKL